MKKLASIMILVMLSVSSCSTEKVSDEEQINLCKLYQETAEAAISARFNGIELSQVIAASREGGFGSDDAITKIIYSVYEIPPYTLPEYQEKAKNEFKNEVFAECMNSK